MTNIAISNTQHDDVRKFIVKVEQKESKKVASISPESFYRIIDAEKKESNPGCKPGWLYMFYVQKCIEQNTTQPLSTDAYCATRLGCNIKSVRKSRKVLQDLGLVELISKNSRKGKIYYTRVNFLPFRIEGPSVNLSADRIPSELMGTYVVYDFYSVWYNRILDNPEPFKNAIRRKMGIVSHDRTMELLNNVWERINTKGYAIERVDNEISFFHYMASSVINSYGSNETQMAQAKAM